MCAFATKMLQLIAHHMHALRITRLLPRHVPFLIFQMCQDPHTSISRNNEVLVHRSRVKDLSKILASVIADAHTDANTKKNGNIDRKIVNGVLHVLHEVKLEASQKAAVLIAACVAEVCGIILNTSYQASGCPKTLNDDLVWRFSTTHVMSTNKEHCTNYSLLRFISMVKNTEKSPFQHRADQKVEERKRFEVPEEKNVSFAKAK